MPPSLATLVLPPEFKEGAYETFKKEIEIWKLMKTCSDEEQGPIVFRSLTGRAKTAALELEAAVIGAKDGLEKILAKLDKLYLPEKNQRICAVLDRFESFKRLPSMTMSSFLLEFERIHGQLHEYGCTYPDGVLAYKIMKASNISKEHEQLCRATVTTGEWSYASVLEQLRKIFSDFTAVKSESEVSTLAERPIKVEDTYMTRKSLEQDCYVGRSTGEDYSYDKIYYQDFTEDDGYDTGSMPNNAYGPEPGFQGNGYREPEQYDIYYGPSKGYRGPWKWNTGKQNFSSSRGRSYQGYRKQYPDHQNFPSPRGYQRMNEFDSSSKQNPYSMNPKDYRGNPTVCRKCRSTFHWWENCPHVTPQEKNNASKSKVLYNENGIREDLFIALFQKSTPTTPDEVICLMGETFNKAVIDSGCTKSCCGEPWLEAYLETLTEDEVKAIQSKESTAVFRFGDSPPVTSCKKILLPLKIRNIDFMLETEVVPSNVPLLLSKETMKRAKAKLNFEDDKIELFGEEQPMVCTSSGHYAIPITKSSANINKEGSAESNIVLFANEDTRDKKATAKKLHTQFCHPSAKRLIKLVESSGSEDRELVQAIEEVSSSCDICKRYKKTIPRPVVTFPFASEFNETVAMDLKIYKNNSIYFLHIVDHVTRFSAASVIRSKRKEVIIDAFFKSWIAVFGPPQKVLSDNGGEFANAAFIDLCQNFNINFLTTAAEAPWSNGLVEKHNGIIGEAVSKIVEDTNCSVEVALCWAVHAKNSLQNIHGFSSYQIVFGKNPGLPSVLNNKLPALERISESQLVADNINAQHKAREALIQLESSERIRRALRSQTRTYSNMKYLSGEEVFYKRDAEKRWRGPGRVIGHDGSKVLIKIPTGLIAAHSCRVILTSDAEKQRLECGEIEFENSAVKGSNDVDTGLQHRHQNDQSLNEVEDRLINNLNLNDNPEVGGIDDAIQRDSDTEDIQEQGDNATGEPTNLMLDHADNTEVEDSGEVGVTNTSMDEQNKSQQGDAVLEETDADGIKKIWRSDDILHTRDLPKINRVVRYKEIDSDQWKRALILSRGGRATGKYKYWMNVKSLEDDTEMCLDWKNKIQEWQDIEENILAASDKLYDYEEAQERELQNWKLLDVYQEVEDHGQEFVSVKWVPSLKEAGGNKVKKARLVARGYEEILETQTDSPTCSKESSRVAIAVISSRQWEINSIDIKAAFLQGKELDREIFLKPPKEGKCPGKLWKLKRAVYGLNDASRFWYLQVKEELCRLGCKNSKFDSALFIYYTDSLEGLLIAHVDDFLWAGTERFQHSVIMRLKQTFRISKENAAMFTYIGIELQKTNEGIYVSQKKYLEDLKEIEIETNRRKEKQSPITEVERQELRSAIGKLNWLATQTRPDLSYEVCELSTSLKNGTVELIMKANKAIKKAKYNTVFLHYPILDLDDITVRCFADASYGNLPDGGSQGGIYTEIVSGSKSAPIEWQSKRLRRTPKSTLAAETIAMVEGIESGFLSSKLLSEIIHNSTKPVPVKAFTDCLSLYEAAHSTTAVTDRRLRIEISILREGLSRKEFELEWVKTESQLADCLTKRGSDPRSLIGRITGKEVI